VMPAATSDVQWRRPNTFVILFVPGGALTRLWQSVIRVAD
jgi:hypothetical protein